MATSDADAIDAPSFTAQTNTAGTYGTFSVTTAGAWTYNLDNTATQVLADGATVDETFTVTSTTADGESVNETVTVTITGSEDAPVVTGTTSGAVTEDGTLTATGSLATTDPDATDTPAFTAQTDTAGTYGTFSVTTAGAWTYSLNNTTAQVLADGATVDETFTVTSTTADGESVNETVTVTVTGSEDTPVITGTTSGAVAEDGTLTATGTLATTDADATDTPAFTAQTNTAGTYGTFSVNTAGAWTYSLNNTAAQALADGATVDETFTVTSTTADGESVNETVTVTVTGSEDAPVITGTNSGAVAEDGTLTATGTLATTDADGADTPSFTAQTDTPGTYGTFSVTTAGAWTYSLNNTAAQVLAGSQTVDETFTVTSTTADGESVNETVTVTVTGSEDAPVIIGTNTGAVSEDGALTATGTLATSDADATDTPAFTAQTDTAGTYGTFSITTAGAWTYNLDNTAAQTLADGATFDETFSVTSTTADGESVNETITVTVTGSEDTPVITGANSGTVAEDGTVTTAELAYTSDNVTNAWYLNGESQALGPNAGTWTRTDTTTVLLPSTGSYQVVFDLSNSGTPTRGNPAGLLVEISGQDVTGDLLTSGNWEWAPYQSVQPIQGVFDFSSLSWSTVSTYGSNGVSPWGTRPSISSQAEWIWSDNNFNSNTDARIFLRANIQADPEDGSLTATGSLATLDTDATDTPAFISQTDTAGTYGTFSVNTAGAWTYDLDNTAAQVLAGSQTVSETFTVTSTTADGESVNETVTVTITGSEDAPVITGITSGAVAEDGTLTATGTLATTDADGADTPSFTAQTDTAGSYGAFSVTTAGAWTYSLNNTATQVPLTKRRRNRNNGQKMARDRLP